MALVPFEENKPPPRPGFVLKRWIWASLALILVIFFILSQINLDSIKEKLVEQVSEKTNLKVEIGSIGLGFSHGLGLKCTNVKVSTPKGENFSVNRLYLLAEWVPLLKGNVKIKSAALEHPQATLEISKKSPEPPALESKKPAEKPALISPERIQAATRKIKDTGLSIEKLIISDGRLTLTRSGTPLQLKIDGNFVLNRAEHLDILANSVRVQTGFIVFEGNGKIITGDNGEISMNVKSGGFSWQEILPVLHFLDNPETPLETADVDQLSINLGAPLSSLSDIENLQQKMSGQLELKIRNTVLNLNSKKHPIELLEGEVSWDEGVLAHNFSGKVLGSDFKLNGKLPVLNPGQDSIQRMEWENLDLKNLPLQKGMIWSPSKGMVSGNLYFTGPLPGKADKFPGKLKGTMEFLAKDLVLTPANPQSGSPIEINHLKGKGDFDQGLLKHELHATVWASDFDIKGDVKLNSKHPVLNSQINWKGLDMAKLPLPPTSRWHPAAGTVSGILKLKGPAPVELEKLSGKLQASFQFESQNLEMQNQDFSPVTFRQLKGNGEIKNHEVSYKINGDPFNGNFQSNGTITLSTSGSRTAVLNNKIEFANLDLSKMSPSNQGILSGKLTLKGPVPDEEKILTGNLNIGADFKVTGLKVSLDAIPVDIQSLEGKASLKKGNLTHDLKGTLFGGNIKTKGNLNFQKDKEKTRVATNSNLILDHVNLNWVPLVLKNEWAPTSGTLTGKLKLKGPLPKNSKISPALKVTGNLQGKRVVLGNPEKQVENVKLVFGEDARIQVEMDRVKLENHLFKKIKALFKISPKKIDLPRGQVWPMSGRINLVGSYKPESGNYRLKFKGKKLRAEEFLPSKIMGPLQLSGVLTGTLPQNTVTSDLPGYSRDLSGNIKLNLVGGSLPELGVLEDLLTLLNPTTVLNDKKAGFGYDYLGGNFKIEKGVVRTKNLEMKSPQVNLDVVGQANLVNNSIKAQIKAMPLQMLDKALQAIPFLGQILTGGKKGGTIETYFKVRGKLSKPDFILEPHKSLTKKPGAILNELINLPKNLNGKKR